MLISSQGVVNSTSKTIYAPVSNYEATLTNLRISNSQAYQISLYRYIKQTNNKTLLYTLQLEAGDIVDDDTTYLLKSGDYLELSSNKDDTSYVVNGHQIPVTV